MKKTEVYGIPYPENTDIAFRAPENMRDIAERTEELMIEMDRRIKELEQRVKQLERENW